MADPCEHIQKKFIILVIFICNSLFRVDRAEQILKRLAVIEVHKQGNLSEEDFVILQPKLKMRWRDKGRKVPLDGLIDPIDDFFSG